VASAGRVQPLGVPARQGGVELTGVSMSSSDGVAGDEWPGSLLALFAASRVEMVRLAHLITGSNGVAEDVVQEAFVRLRAQWHRVDNPGGYLRTTVVNLSRGHLRRRGVERRHVVAEPIDHSGPPDRRLTGDPEIDDTWAAVRRLPPRQRAVLALRFYEDLPLAEIAQVLGCRLGTVKSNLHRGLARLRKELS
jgi:RNA polymerase sigma-70 factor (sigma-E family)